MAEHQYYSEEVLIEKMERGEYGWLDYVNHFSPEWQEEYARYCKAHSLMAGNQDRPRCGHPPEPEKAAGGGRGGR